MVVELFVFFLFGESRDFCEDVMEIFLFVFDWWGLKVDCIYMVVGGMCGFGFEVVKWMVEFGVKIIVFVVCLEFLELKFLEVFELKELIGVNIVLY